MKTGALQGLCRILVLVFRALGLRVLGFGCFEGFALEGFGASCRLFYHHFYHH